MDNKFYIKKFIRDDGQSLSFDGVQLFLAQDNTLLVAPDPETSAASFTEQNGGEMLRQRLDTVEQPVKGLLVPKTSDFWTLIAQLRAFWQINHTYKIVYVKRSGGLFAIDGAWISSSLQVSPPANEQYAEWSVGLTVGNDVWREFAEDASGEETYANSVDIPLLASAVGGEDWDDVGLVADEVGEVWIEGAGGIQSIMISSSSTIYPVWTVTGPSVNPSLQNNTTDTEAMYLGTVAEGQTLVVDFESGVARLDGSLVTRLVSGVVSCVPGENLIGFNSDGGATNVSTLSWNNII